MTERLPILERVAEEIVDHLFTTGTPTKGNHLKIYKDGRYLAGWAERPAVAEVLKILRKHS